MSHDNEVLRTSDDVDTDGDGSCDREVCYQDKTRYFDDERCVSISDTGVTRNVIEDAKKHPGSSSSEQVRKKVKLKRLRREEYDVEKASKYFESADFRRIQTNVIVEISLRDREAGVATNSDKEGRVDDYDSDVSTSSGENGDGSGHSRIKTGSYDFVSAGDDDVESSDAEIYDDSVSVRTEGNSEFDSEQECSSLSGSESEDYDSIDEDDEEHDSGAAIKRELDYSEINELGNDEVDNSCIVSKVRRAHNLGKDQERLTEFKAACAQSDQLSGSRAAGYKKRRSTSYETACRNEDSLNEISNETHFSADYTESESHSDILENREELDPVEGEEGNEENDPHGLIRKPAMRRKGYAWVSKSLPKNPGRNNKRLKYRDLESGPSQDLAPSIFNLYDHRIASWSGDRDSSNDHIGVRAATKTRSLPARSDDDATYGAQYDDVSVSTQRQPADSPVSMMDSEIVVPMAVSDNKKRPLSRDSVSSNSFTTSPRLRKRRGNSVTGDDFEVFEENMHCSDSTIVPDCTSEGASALQSRNAADINSVQKNKNEDRYMDRMSITSSGSSSCRDEAEYNSSRDSSELPSSVSDRINVSKPSAHGSHFKSHSNEPDNKTSDNGSNSIPMTLRSKTSNQSKQKVAVSFPESGQTLPDSQSPERHSIADVGTTSSPDILRRSSSSSSRQEARMKFFTNYDEYMSQSSSPQTPIVEENVTTSSESQPLSFSKSSSVPLSSSSLATATSASVAEKNNSRNTKSQSLAYQNTPSATTLSEGRRDSSSKISRSSEKTSRRSDRRGSATKRDGFLSSSRSGFSRSSKKRDHNASPDAGNRSSQGHVSYVSRVVSEIIESERTYIASLEDIIHGYLEPMEKILNTHDEKKDIECLFSNVREIYKFGCTFLADLEKAGTDCVKVAECFVRHNKGFVIYTDYCTNYPRAVEVLTRFMQHPELSELCKERQVALGHGLPLGAYLLKPVQRILKYHLLLHNIVKNCEKEKEEAEILEQAFHHMTEMAHHINEMKRKHEHAVRIQEIQSQLEDYEGEDLTRLGELVLEGTFKVYGAKASRQVFLFEKGLLISKKKEGGMLSCKALIPCSNLMLVEVIPNEPFSFHIIPFDNPRAQYTLQARNMEQKRRWCQDIKQLILESFKGRIPDNVKNLIMQLGREHDDDYISKEALEAGRKNQHTAPEYLEKRRFRGKSGSRIPDFGLLKPNRAKRGGNKKGDIRSAENTKFYFPLLQGDERSAEKMSPETARRAKSKSPDVNRRILAKENVAAKGRSQSSSSFAIPVSESSKANLESSHAITQEVTKAAGTTSPISPGSPVYRKSHKFNYSEDGEEDTSAAEGIKRPASFLMARANPILSADLTLLLARCGGVTVQSPASLNESKENGEMLPAHTNLHDLSGKHDSQNRSDWKNSSGGEQQPDEGEQIWGEGRRSTDATIDLTERDIEQPSKSSEKTPALSETEVSPPSSLDQNVKDSRTVKPKLANYFAPNKSGKCEDEFGVCDEKSEKAASPERKGVSQSTENVNISQDRHHVSRRDTQRADENLNNNGVTADGNEQEMQSSDKDMKVMAFHDIYSKSAAENALKMKGLRLPNTSKHLLAWDYGSDLHSNSDGIKAKLTNWNSVEKLTKGSMDDLSHLDEDPWVRNSEATSSMLNMDAEPPRLRPSAPTYTRPRGHSDITEMLQVSNNKENMDWIVYRNRNSPPSLKNQSSGHKMRVSTSVLDKYSTVQENSDVKSEFPSQISYVTPPRGYMTLENMKRLGSMKVSDKDDSFGQACGDGNSNNFTSRKVNAFGPSPVTVTTAKPVSFTSAGLVRSNSTPISDIDQDSVATADSKERPVSLDIDRFNDVGNGTVAEVNSYISSSSESMKNASIPITLPTIKVEEEADSNRLSVVSSISTSSYESQGSSSSDGLVGTLKSKLHAWAKHSRSRHDSDISCASTLTSDDEDRDVQSKSGNTFESSAMKRNSWKEDRQLESVLREHSLGSSKLGSRMAHSVPQPEQVILHHCSDPSVHESHPMSNYGFVNEVSEEFEKLSPDQSQYSLPATTETTEALIPPAFKNCDIQQSDSGFSLQSNESNNSDPAPSKQTDVSEIALDLSEESSKEGTPKAKQKNGKTKTQQKSSDLERSDSLGSFESHDSFYERKLSAAFDSDVFQAQSEPEQTNEQEIKEAVLPKKSIREYVKNLEEKLRTQSPKIFEVTRREPGAMIRQRLKTLRESALHGWRSASISSSRYPSEEKPVQLSHLKTFSIRKDSSSENIAKSICLKPASSRDSLSISVENLSKSRDNLFLSRSRDSLNSISRSRDSLSSVSDAPGNRHSTPVFSLKAKNSGHENDANRFHYRTPEQSHAISGNQFVHRAQRGSQHSLSESEIQLTMAEGASSMQFSKSVSRLNEPSHEADNLVVMKGWVKSLISKFQVKS